MNTILLRIPLDNFGHLATAAALEGVDITRFVKREIRRAADDGTLARFAVARKADTAAPDTAAHAARKADK